MLSLVEHEAFILISGLKTWLTSDRATISLVSKSGDHKATKDRKHTRTKHQAERNKNNHATSTHKIFCIDSHFGCAKRQPMV